MQRSNNKTFMQHSSTKGYEKNPPASPFSKGGDKKFPPLAKGGEGGFEMVFLEQKGTALLIAMIMLLLVTLIGFAAITTSSIEVMISGNQRLSSTSLYAAEAAIESIRQELNNSAPPYGDQFTLNNGTSASPEYSIFGGIESWPGKGDPNMGDKWTVSSPIVPNRNCPVMYVFLVEGRSGLAIKRIEVGILAPDYDWCGSSRTEYRGGTS